MTDKWWKNKWWPWPSRAERKANVAIALDNAARARRAAKKAEELASELRAMEKDKLAWAIMEGLQVPDVKNLRVDLEQRPPPDDMPRHPRDDPA